MEVFSVDDIVWAKSSVAREIFWPAKVVESDSDTENDKLSKKKPVLAFVNFLAENTFEAIRNPSRIQHFNCKRKDHFLKKGRSLKNQMKRLDFESAVKQAETSLRICDTMKQRSSPRIRSRDLSEQEKRTSRIHNDFKILTKCSLETILEESSDNITDNASTRPKRTAIEKVKGKITKKKSGICKAKTKMNLKKTNRWKQIGKVKRSNRKNKLKTEELVCEIELNEGHLKSSCANSSRTGSVLAVSIGNEGKRKKDSNERKNKRDTLKTSLVGRANKETRRTHRSNSLNEASTSSTSEMNYVNVKKTRNSYSESGTKATRRNCVTNELSFGRKDSCEVSNVDESGHFKTNIKVPCRGRRSKTSSKKTLASESSVESCSKTLSTRSKDKIKSKSKTIFESERIPEEHESEITRTPRQRRLEKRRRNEIENSKSRGKSGRSRESKRLRVTLSQDDNLGFKTQISPGQIDASESSSGTNNKEAKAEHVSSKRKQTLKAVDVCLEGLNGSSCGNTHDSEDKLGILGSERLQITEEGFGCEEKESKFKNITGNELDSGDVNETKVDAEDNLNDDGSSDDESLPEAFSLSPVAKKYFQPGDVVWIKHTKYPFWPGQIAYHKKRKSYYYYVRFLPEKGFKGMKIHKKNIKSFTANHETHEQFKHQEMDPSLRKEFEESVKQAEDILFRRVFQKDDILLDEIEDQGSELSDDDDEPPFSRHLKLDKPVNEVDKLVDEPVEEPEDDESGFDDSSETENHESAGNGRSQEQGRPVLRYSNILNELHQCKQRLLDIYREKVDSSRHRIYNYGTATEKNHLKHMAGFGPIQDDETRERIIRLLKSWYDEERKTCSVSPGYIWDVWLPEAMIHYMQITDNLTAADAEKIYLDHKRHVDKRDVRETTNWLKKQTIDEATMQETVERARRKLCNIFSS